MNEQLIWMAIYYLDYETSTLWESLLNPVAPITWDEFKDVVQELYPGADGACLYSTRDLECLLAEWATKGVFMWGDFGEYHRDFTHISTDLLSHGRIDQESPRRLYISGFGNTTQRKIEAHLAIIDPHHHPDDSYPTRTVQTAAEFLLSAQTVPGYPAAVASPYVAVPMASSITPPYLVALTYLPQTAHQPAVLGASRWSPAQHAAAASPSDLSPFPPLTVPTQIKQEPFDMQLLISTLVSEVVKQTTATQSSQGSGHNNNNNNNYPRTNNCHFCGNDGCRVVTCDLAAEYICLRKCTQGADGRLTLSSGQFMPRGTPGAMMAECFDNYTKLAAPAVPTVTAAMMETIPCTMIEEIGSDSEEEEEEEVDYVWVMANELRKEKEKDKGKKKVEVVIPKPKPAVKIVEKTADPKPATTSATLYHKSEPQYRYKYQLNPQI
jgi:hypothetical protein